MSIWYLGCMFGESEGGCGDGKQLESNGAVFPEEELETHTIAEWKEEKQGLVATTRHSLVSVSLFVCYCSSSLVQNQDHNSHLRL